MVQYHSKKLVPEENVIFIGIKNEGEKMRVMGIIKDVEFGTRDIGQCCLWFTAYRDESLASLQMIPAKEAVKLIEKNSITNINNLENHPCWLEVNDDGGLGNCKFIELCNIP